MILARADIFNVTLRNETLPVSPRTHQFVGLDKFTNYTVHVAAFTRKGIGVFSTRITVSTDEDGACD